MTQSRWKLANATAIPGTGKRASFTRFFRRPRNGSIKRAIVAAGGSLRGETVPPSSWDDIARRPQRSWKEHRRYRWKDHAP